MVTDPIAIDHAIDSRSSLKRAHLFAEWREIVLQGCVASFIG